MKKFILALLGTYALMTQIHYTPPAHFDKQLPQAKAMAQDKAPEVVQPKTEEVKPVESPPPAPQPQVQEQTVQQAQANVTLNPTSCEAYRPLVMQYAWDVRVAMAIMRAESGCNPGAHNPEAHRDIYGNVICYGSFGLFQISCHGGQIYDPAQNVAAAWAKYTAKYKDGSIAGWRPWGAFNSGAYLRYL